MIIKTLKFMALLVAITSLSACASDSAPKANGDITSQATQPPSDVLDIEFVIEDIDDIDDTEDIEDTDDIDDIDAIDAADDNSNFSEIPRSSDEPMLFDDNEDIDPALDNPRIGRATDKPLQIEDIDDSDPSLENPSIARATDKPLQLEDDDDSGDSDGDFDIPEIPRSDPQTPYWSELDFDKNIEYAEAIETFGDLGAAKGAISAFNKMRDERLIPDYNATASYWMTFTGIKDIKGEDCYVYRFEEIDVCMSFACAVKSGNVYYVGNGDWVSTNGQSYKPVADTIESYDLDSTDPVDKRYAFSNSTQYSILYLVGTMPGNVYFHIYAGNNSSTGDVTGLMHIDKSEIGKWVDPLGHGALEFEFDDEANTVTVKDTTEGLFTGTGVSFDGTYDFDATYVRK